MENRISTRVDRFAIGDHATRYKLRLSALSCYLLPARVNLTRHKDSVDHTGQENIWFVGCLTTARATPASREGALTL